MTIRNRSRWLVKSWATVVLTILVGCSRNEGNITYICEEPLEKYLDLARKNIQNNYEVERSQRTLTTCPEKGFFRRYEFSFPASALVSKRGVEAQVKASWCNDSVTRTAEAHLETYPTLLTFGFTYPWSTATGKYPRTEFRLNRITLRGGFFDDLEWSCALETPNA